jgi:hypothetical protein
MSERASIFDKPKPAIDVSGFAPRSDSEVRPRPEDLEQLTRGSKFRSREGAEPDPAPARVQQRRRRTGRNVQFNIRATQQVIDEFKALSEEMDWPDGLTLEKALRALKRELEGQGS